MEGDESRTPWGEERLRPGVVTRSAIYHQLTSYVIDRPWFVPVEDDRVDQDFIPLDDETAPSRTQSYAEELPTREPPSEWIEPLRDALGWVDRSGRLRRAAPSAGGCHPIEAYLLASDGVWRYEPDQNGGVGLLRRVGEPARRDATTIVVTGVPWRTCWRYAERGYRHLWWDAGTVAAYLMARIPHVPLTAMLGFVDADLAKLVGAGSDQLPLVVLTDSGSGPRLGPVGQSFVPEPSGAPHFALVDVTHAAGDLVDDAAVARWTRPATGDGPALHDAGAAVRAVPRRIVPGPVDRAQLEVVAAALAATPTRDSGPDRRRFVLLVADVPGLEAGVYVLDHDGPHRLGTWDRKRSRAVFLDQQHAEDAAAVLLQWTLPAGDRDYRAVHFAAGYGLGAAYLTAAEHGVAVRAATVCDGAVTELLGAYLPPDAFALVGLAVGA